MRQKVEKKEADKSNSSLVNAPNKVKENTQIEVIQDNVVIRSKTKNQSSNGDITTFKCKVCSKSFNDENELTTHWNEHSLYCNDCKV